MNSDMNMYFCEIGGAPHRFNAINRYAARVQAKQRAELVGVGVWTDPVRYNPVVHERHFGRESRL